MFIIMAVGLYTSRVILKVLGISDYGVYNVVGGIITMIAFLNSAMVASSQRFISYELGRGDFERLNKVFSTSVNIHLTICLIAVLFGETFGLWFVNTQLNIPEGRMTAANWVYQASIVTFLINVMSVPYNSAIVAHEKMSAFAYISFLDVTLKLLIVYMLIIIPTDKLISYSVLMVCVGLIIRSCYVVYCKRHFKECTYHFINDKYLFKEMFAFAGWSVLGNLGFSFKDQLSNVILNLFYGTTLNAARGIGMQVTGVVNMFANNFTMALHPQITKQYASGDIDASRKLVYAGSRYSFYLLTLISVPVFLNIDFILKLWLEIVPQYTNLFVIFSLGTAMIYAMSNCVTIAIQATGRIKWFQIGICIIMLSELPIAWVLMELGYPPHAVMWPSLFTYSFALLFRFFLICRYVEGYVVKDYLVNVVLRCLLVFSSSYFVSFILCKQMKDNIIGFILSSVFSVLIVVTFVWFFGIYEGERKILVDKVKNRFL